MSERSLWSRVKPRKSRVLFQITLLLVVIFILSCLCTFLIFSGSQDRLIESSKDKLLDQGAQSAYSVYDYLSERLMPQIREEANRYNLVELINSLLQKKVTPLQEFVNREYQEMVDKKFLGITTHMLVTTSIPGSSGPILTACNDASLIYNERITPFIEMAIGKGTPYFLMRDGIPELGLLDEQLVIVRGVEDPQIGLKGYLISVKPMHEEIASIDQFYNSEKRRTDTFFILITLATLLALVIAAFFVLSYLLYKNITRPIDELSAVAEQVIQGNLDVQIQVEEGEEFETLKRAFKEMVENWRRIMARATGEAEKGD